MPMLRVAAAPSTGTRVPVPIALPRAVATAVVLLVRHPGAPVYPGVNSVVELANGGDSEARRLIRDSGRHVGEVLAGVSLEAIVSCAGASFRESILFTHRGLSGPAILQISSYWRQGDMISLDLAPACEANAFLLERKRSRPRCMFRRSPAAPSS